MDIGERYIQSDLKFS